MHEQIVNVLDIRRHDLPGSLHSLKDRIVDGVIRASRGARQLPIEVMYSDEGLTLFDEYSQAEGYYIFKAERQILEKHANEMALFIEDRANIVELGSGSLEKTQKLLQGVSQAGHITEGVSYYAIDINREALLKSLSTLPPLKHVQCHGLFGTYQDGLHYVKRSRTRKVDKQAQHVFVWLGASIGNLSLEDAVGMVRSVTDVMAKGDMILIGIDGWNSEDRVNAAYEPADRLVLASLVNANKILGQPVFDMDKFEFSTRFNQVNGCNECSCMAKEALQLTCGPDTVCMDKGEKILVVPSHKYKDERVVDLVRAVGGLEVVRQFGMPVGSGIHYGVWMWRKVSTMLADSAHQRESIAKI